MLGGLKPIELLETPIIIGQSAAKLIIYYNKNVQRLSRKRVELSDSKREAPHMRMKI